jgi:hypothetical protein
VHHGRALRTATELGQPYAIAEALEGMAETVAASDDPERAVELLGTAATVRSRMGVAKRAMQRGRDLEALAGALRRSLGGDRYALALARGQEQAPTEVIAALRGC